MSDTATKKIIDIILKNRGIVTKQQKEDFLNPKLEKITFQSLKINKKEVLKAVSRIKKAIKDKEQIVVFGDYDTDGICAAAIVWEALDELKANVMPYIPHRIDEGYGFSLESFENLKKKYPKVGLIITVDNGIVANRAIEKAKKENIDVVITDHHQPSDKKPDAFAIIHTQKLCGAGIAWFFSKQLIKKDLGHLELAAIGTIADIVPLTEANRAIVKFGLEKIRQTKRIGLLEIIKESALDKKLIGVYEIGHIIAPRINAMGRIDSAMDSLRLVCAKNRAKAEELALKHGEVNRKRQSLTEETVLHAIGQVGGNEKKLLFISHKTYQQGLIGLVASRLVEEYYRPAIVISEGETYCKGSARSISGVNIIDLIRKAQSFLVDAGGHPMAAGFTVETKKLLSFQSKLEQLARKIDDSFLIKKIKFDCLLDLRLISLELFDEINKLQPFGPGNPQPVFKSKAIVNDMRWVGGNKHLSLFFEDPDSGIKLKGIVFGFKDEVNLRIGDKVEIIYSILKDVWNNNQRIQLRIKQIIKKSS